MVDHCGVALGLLFAQESLLFLQVAEFVVDFRGPVVDEEGDPGVALVALRLHSERQELVANLASRIFIVILS